MKTFDNNAYLNSVYFLNKFSMYEDHETTASDSTGSNMKTTEEKPLKSLYDLEYEWGNSTDTRSCKRYIYDYMQAYADQQVNKVLDKAIRLVLKYQYDTKVSVANELESLKIKQP